MKGPAITQLARAADSWNIIQILNSSISYSTVVQPFQADQSYSFQIIPHLGKKAGIPSVVLTLNLSKGSSLTTGQIIGIVVGTVLGALLLLILLILLVCCICRRKSKEQKTVYGQKTKSSAVANPQNPSSTLQRQATPVSRMTANNRVSITATGERPVSVASSFWDAESFNKNFNYEAENSSTQYGRHNNVAKNSLRTATTV
ncbi:V-set and immunoglobulin domain-containing protein 10-like [Protopterus annectens]|uniref:V-set and immunoglobulin domain-containing protein 10-like n=1 Tax=Protopterus annectens TaxID=7888 RepID=UPI001CFA60CD|nr:V-set and immunoglobulin domain-containing protein 10-like [Protopterus annectens]